MSNDKSAQYPATESHEAKQKEVFGPYGYCTKKVVTLLADEKPTSVQDARESVHHKLLEMRQSYSEFINLYVKIRQNNTLGNAKNARSAKTLVVQRDSRVVTLLSEAYDRCLKSTLKELMEMNTDVMQAAKCELKKIRNQLIVEYSGIEKKCQSLISVQAYINEIYDDQSQFIGDVLGVVQDDDLTFGMHLSELEGIRTLLSQGVGPKIKKESSVAGCVESIQESISYEMIENLTNAIEQEICSAEVDFEIGILKLDEIYTEWKPTLLQAWHSTSEFYQFVRQAADEMVEQVKELDSIYISWQRRLDDFKTTLQDANLSIKSEMDWQESITKSIKSRMYKQEELVYTINELLEGIGHRTALSLGKISENRKIHA